MMDQTLAALPDEPQYALQRADCHIRSAEFSFFTGVPESMIDNASRAIELLDSIPGITSLKRIDAEASLAYGYYLAQENRKADEAFAHVMSALERVGRDRTVAAADTLNNWSLVHYLGNLQRSEQLIRSAVELRRSIEGGSVSPTATHNHAGVLLQLARYSEAEALFEETIRTAAARKEQRIELDATMELAQLYIERGELERAAAQLAQVESLRSTPLFPTLAQARGDLAAARTRFAETVAFFERNKWKIGMSVHALIGLARAKAALGDEAASTSAQRALSLAESWVEPEALSYLVGYSLVAIGDIHQQAGRTVDARQAWEKAQLHLEKTLGPDHPASRSVRDKLAS
jgi:tetratricopeptide (TPR) repeat protein